MTRVFRVVFVLSLALAGYGVYRWLKPSDEQRIRTLLAEAAKAVSWAADANTLEKLAGAGRLAGMCTPDVEVAVDFGGARVLQGPDQVREAAAAARATLAHLTVELGQVEVRVGPDGASATAQAVTTVRAAGWGEPLLQEFRFHLRRIDGAWRIGRVEPVRGFGQ